MLCSLRLFSIGWVVCCVRTALVEIFTIKEMGIPPIHWDCAVGGDSAAIGTTLGEAGTQDECLIWLCSSCTFSCRSVPKSNPTMCQKIIPAICSRARREQESLEQTSMSRTKDTADRQTDSGFQAKKTTQQHI
ncbi:hypothetical protein BO94DRAFT_306273 [Aspergillus sclerotioniger CBS 115572]|uniref:Secreted protein n=1 Tax=Aspergillus sclerotioniger CBS 115572 TaxID=1450535 RepID=A0A317UZU6_9EURO|nr:hypothetical protein BO94DRAFT_306273 [Aspergillus sclerotioniger CBS 115572]PWY67583.1 hypothetical protein BO94DRAFT_306273 [Aspergillus sclerotioniger CBS 115572]